MVRNHNRKFKIEIHSYTLYLSGFGESQGFREYGEHHALEQVATFKGLVDITVEIGLDVLHITLADIQNDTSDAHLTECRKIAEEAGIELELNVLFNAPSSPHANCDVENSLHIAHKLGYNLVKYSTDVEHPEKSSHSCLAPSVMGQLVEIYDQFERNLPLIKRYGMKVAIENRCDLFVDKVVQLVKQLDHPLVGVCCNIINSLMVVEGIAEYACKMAPYCYCIHSCDSRVFADPDGTHSLGTAIGAGSADCRAIMGILKEEAPDGLDTIDPEIELPLSGYSVEENREVELRDLCEPVECIYKESGIDHSPAKIYGPNNCFLNK